MLKKLIAGFSISALIFINISCGQQINFGKVAEAMLGSGAALTTNDIANGLKEALVVGITNGSAVASQTDGYFNNPLIKIALPEEVQKIGNTLRRIGLGSEVDKFEMALNRGAEQAAEKAKPIFISAIRQMTITDALSILRGDKDAATQYLQRVTSEQLLTAFSPVVQNALDQTQATKYYTDIATRYNSIPLVQPINADMSGLFKLIAKEEEKIRENPLARTTDLLKRVFGSTQAVAPTY
ncbi:MAG: hypothetical protein ACI8WW_001275 [Oceanospirillaceae bacterium]|jgi:hypothetical protein